MTSAAHPEDEPEAAPRDDTGSQTLFHPLPNWPERPPSPSTKDPPDLADSRLFVPTRNVTR